MMPIKFGITVTAKMKHAALWEAANKLGGQSALGRALGIHPTVIGRWVNLKDCPPTTIEEATGQIEKLPDEGPGFRWTREKFLHVEKTLFELTGQMMEDLFPNELRENEAFLAESKTISRTEYIDSHLLANYGQERFLLPSPVDEASKDELRSRINQVLHTLPYRECEILKLRFGLGDGHCYTYQEIEHLFRVTRERIRQIEAAAIRHLQQPIRSQKLVEFLDTQPDTQPTQLALTTSDWEQLGKEVWLEQQPNRKTKCQENLASQ